MPSSRIPNTRTLSLLSLRAEALCHAVYGLLEDHLGCHWPGLGDAHAVIPKRTTVTIKIPNDCLISRPALQCRQVAYLATVTAGFSEQEQKDFAVFLRRNRAGRLRGDLDKTWGTIYPVNAQKRFESLCPLINGKRQPVEGQICLDSPEAVELARQYFTERFKHFGGADFAGFAPSSDQWCQCPTCRNISFQPSGRLITLTQNVLAAIDDVRDNKRLAIYLDGPSAVPPEKPIVADERILVILHPSQADQAALLKGDVSVLDAWNAHLAAPMWLQMDILSIKAGLTVAAENGTVAAPNLTLFLKALPSANVGGLVVQFDYRDDTTDTAMWQILQAAWNPSRLDEAKP